MKIRNESKWENETQRLFAEVGINGGNVYGYVTLISFGCLKKQQTIPKVLKSDNIHWLLVKARIDLEQQSITI